MTPAQPAFGGSKTLLFYKDQLLTYLRDDLSNIPYLALWDLPGGGAEGDETFIECALRETKE